LSCPFLMEVLGTSPRMTVGGRRGVCGGCQDRKCPFLHGVLGTGPRMTEGGKEVLATMARKMAWGWRPARPCPLPERIEELLHADKEARGLRRCEDTRWNASSSWRCGAVRMAQAGGPVHMPLAS